MKKEAKKKKKEDVSNLEAKHPLWSFNF